MDADGISFGGGAGRERRKLQAKQRRKSFRLDGHLRACFAAIPFNGHGRFAAGFDCDALDSGGNFDRLPAGDKILALQIFAAVRRLRIHIFRRLGRRSLGRIWGTLSSPAELRGMSRRGGCRKRINSHKRLCWRFAGGRRALVFRGIERNHIVRAKRVGCCKPDGFLNVRARWKYIGSMVTKRERGIFRLVPPLRRIRAIEEAVTPAGACRSRLPGIFGV